MGRRKICRRLRADAKRRQAEQQRAERLRVEQQRLQEEKLKQLKQAERQRVEQEKKRIEQKRVEDEARRMAEEAQKKKAQEAKNQQNVMTKITGIPKDQIEQFKTYIPMNFEDALEDAILTQTMQDYVQSVKDKVHFKEPSQVYLYEYVLQHTQEGECTAEWIKRKVENFKYNEYPCDCGDMRLVHYATLDNNDIVLKKYWRPIFHKQERYKSDLQMQVVCSKFAKLLNISTDGKSKIKFLDAKFIEYDGEIGTIERKISISTWEKYNNNNGYVNDNNTKYTQIANAFSHYSNWISRGQILICDIQGIVSNETCVYTDPQIHSQDDDVDSYGCGNQGVHGMNRFFSTHICNEWCKYFLGDPQELWEPRTCDRMCCPDKHSSVGDKKATTFRNVSQAKTLANESVAQLIARTITYIPSNQKSGYSLGKSDKQEIDRILEGGPVVKRQSTEILTIKTPIEKRIIPIVGAGFTLCLIAIGLIFTNHQWRFRIGSVFGLTTTYLWTRQIPPPFQVVRKEVTKYQPINSIETEYKRREDRCRLGFYISNFAYCSKLEPVLPKEISVYEKSNSFVIAKTQHQIIIGFKGTNSLADLITDLNAIPTLFSDRGARSSHNKEKRCHSGFWKYCCKLKKDSLMKHLHNEEHKEIIVTGHSLGGAAAILYTLEVLLPDVKYFQHVYCVTFGAPMAINDGYRDVIPSEWSTKFENYVNDQDFIPIAPICWTKAFSNFVGAAASLIAPFRCNYVPFGTLIILLNETYQEEKRPELNHLPYFSASEIFQLLVRKAFQWKTEHKNPNTLGLFPLTSLDNLWTKYHERVAYLTSLTKIYPSFKSITL